MDWSGPQFDAFRARQSILLKTKRISQFLPAGSPEAYSLGAHMGHIERAFSFVFVTPQGGTFQTRGGVNDRYYTASLEF